MQSVLYSAVETAFPAFRVKRTLRVGHYGGWKELMSEEVGREEGYTKEEAVETGMGRI